MVVDRANLADPSDVVDCLAVGIDTAAIYQLEATLALCATRSEGFAEIWEGIAPGIFQEELLLALGATTIGIEN